MRVQTRHHAHDGIGDEFFVVDRFHVVGFDHAKNGGQLLQLFEWQGRQRSARHGL